MDRSPFGMHLERLRKDRGLSAKALSRISGLTVSYVSRAERGELNPSADAVKQIAAALNLTSDERDALLHAAVVSAQPAAAEALAPPIPASVVWRYLPAAILKVEHDAPEPPEVYMDDTLARVTPALAALLGWIVLHSQPPSEAQLKRLRTSAEAVMSGQRERMRREARGLARSESDLPAQLQPAAVAKAALPYIWRSAVMAHGAERLLARVRYWRYLNVAGGRLLVELAEPDAANGFSWINPDLAARCYDALAAARLWSLTGLADQYAGLVNLHAQEAARHLLPDCALLQDADACRRVDNQDDVEFAQRALEFARLTLRPLGPAALGATWALLEAGYPALDYPDLEGAPQVFYPDFGQKPPLPDAPDLAGLTGAANLKPGDIGLKPGDVRDCLNVEDVKIAGGTARRKARKRDRKKTTRRK